MNESAEFGGWVVDHDRRAVVHLASSYDIEFERLTSAGDVLDWILQIADKWWAGPEALDGLIRAIASLYGGVGAMQGYLCPSGTAQSVATLPLEE